MYRITLEDDYVGKYHKKSIVETNEATTHEVLDSFCRLMVSAAWSWDSVKEAIEELNERYNNESNY